MNRPLTTASTRRPRRGAAGLASLITVLAGCGQRLEVACVTVRRAEIREAFTEPAQTRLPRTHRIALPVTGRIARIDLEPGDRVEAKQELVSFDRVPLEQAVVEARARVKELEAQITVKDNNRIEETAMVETKATIDAASEALKASDAQVEAEKVRAERAAKELGRIRSLAASDLAAQRDLDDAEVAAETSTIELRRQEFYRAAMRALLVAVRLGPRYVEEYLGRKRLERQVMVHQLAQARAQLVRAEHELGLAAVLAPIDGVVLERHEQGESMLPAGRPLLLIGNLAELEAVADVLTQDAMRLSPGCEVALEPASGVPPIAGRVKRIEPAGFTKLSSLGVEQQRVKVIVSLEGETKGLGVGYRLHARFFTRQKADALVVPRFSVLQAPDQSFYVFRIEKGILRRQAVRVGLRGDQELEITEGLRENDRIVATPDTTLSDGQRVTIDEG